MLSTLLTASVSVHTSCQVYNIGPLVQYIPVPLASYHLIMQISFPSWTVT